jgi:hypothetical protein
MPMAVRSKPVLRSVTDKPPIARWRINLVGESLVSFSFEGFGHFSNILILLARHGR